MPSFPFAPLTFHLHEPLYPTAEWSAQHGKYATWRRYFLGHNLDETVGEGKHAAQKYPVKLNFCRNIALLNAFAMLGEWDERVFSWSSHSFDDKEKPDRDGGLTYLDRLAHASWLNSRYVRQLLTLQVFGGMVWGLRQRPDLPTRAVWTLLSPEIFYPVFSSLDGDLIEARIKTQISGVEAQRVYNVRPKAPVLQYEEVWTKQSYRVLIDNETVRRGPTPAGVIPFCYIPRTNIAGEPYGESAFADILGLQDELNLRVGDIGDGIAKETHKDVYVSNVPGGARGITRYGRFVDLGMGMGNNAPDVHEVDRGVVPTGSFDLVKVLVDFTRHSAMTPAVAYGEDEGSQRSSMTLVVRMWPMLRQAKANRALVVDALSDFADKTFRVARAAGLSIDTGNRLYRPDLPPLLPKDREQTVNEVATLWNGGQAPLISPERALDVLDVPEDERADELARIEKLRNEAMELEREMMEMQLSMERQKMEQQMELNQEKHDQQMTLSKEKMTLQRQQQQQRAAQAKAKPTAKK